MSELVIRNIQERDLDQVMAVQFECYTEIEPESRSAIQRKVKLSGDTCWVAELDDEILAYLICHPWLAGTVPALDAEAMVLPDQVDLFYIHDLAVSPRGQGRGLAKRLIQKALSYAKSTDFQAAGLIAVQESSKFWEKFGFVSSTSVQSESVEKLQAYGDTAVYMENKWQL